MHHIARHSPRCRLVRSLWWYVVRHSPRCWLVRSLWWCVVVVRHSPRRWLLASHLCRRLALRFCGHCGVVVLRRTCAAVRVFTERHCGGCCAPQLAPLATCIAPAPQSAVLRTLCWLFATDPHAVGYLCRTCAVARVFTVTVAFFVATRTSSVVGYLLRRTCDVTRVFAITVHGGCATQPASLATTCVAPAPLSAFLRTLWW